MARSEAYDHHPEHTLLFDDPRMHARVRCGDRLIAETRRGLNLREGKYPPVVYIPREDVRMDLLASSDHTTHCPFKGDASYFDVARRADDQGVTHAAWSYEDPFDQMESIRGYLAFYPDRVTIEVDPD